MALEPSSCRMTHRAGGNIFTDSRADLVSVPCSWCLHRKPVPADSAGDALLAEQHSVGSKPVRRWRKEESTCAKTEQNPPGRREPIWSSSCSGGYWGNVKEQELVSYITNVREKISALLRVVFYGKKCLHVKSAWVFPWNILSLSSQPSCLGTWLQPSLSEVNLLHWTFIPDHRQSYLRCFKCASSLCDLFICHWTLHCYDFYPSVI